jgi:Fur family transcriptional regulator, ferric uptake regulator
MSKVGKPVQPTGHVPTVEEVLDIFRARGGRITNSRRLLLHALVDKPRDRTAEELALEVHDAAPDINLSTIYRNLDELEQLGIVIHAHLGHGPATYNLAALAHGHLVCDKCGAVIEAPGELFQDLENAAQTRYGFEIDPHHFAVPGLCQTCRLSETSTSFRRHRSG